MSINGDTTGKVLVNIDFTNRMAALCGWMLKEDFETLKECIHRGGWQMRAFENTRAGTSTNAHLTIQQIVNTYNDLDRRRKQIEYIPGKLPESKIKYIVAGTTKGVEIVGKPAIYTENEFRDHANELQIGTSGKWMLQKLYEFEIENGSFSELNEAKIGNPVRFTGIETVTDVSDESKVIAVTVEGGVVEDVKNIPAGYIVEIRDYDTEGCDDDDLSTDASGEQYSTFVYGSEA